MWSHTFTGEVALVGLAGQASASVSTNAEEDQLRYVEQKAGITFKRVGVPTPSDIIKSSSKDIVRFLDSVPPQAIEYFRVAATKLIEERGAVDSLAAALAHISGATALEQRSLLNSDAVSVQALLTHTFSAISM
jgi:DNA transposition AAA+ family ATPase